MMEETDTLRRTRLDEPHRGTARRRPSARTLVLTALLGCLLTACASASASAAVLKADYGFAGTLASSVLPAPDLTQAGTCPTPNNFATETVNLVADQVLVFDAGCGLQLDTSTLVAPGSYSFALQFRFIDVTGFRRVFDASPGLADNGLYVVDGALRAFPVGANFTAPVGSNTWGQLVMTRDATTQEVIVYFDGVRQFSFIDSTNDELITAAQMPRFLVDDTTENGAGAVSRLRLYDAPLTPAEVAALDGNALSDVSVTTTADVSPAYAGLPFGYSIAVTDAGPPATGVTVSDTLPAGVDFVSASPGCTEINRVVTCDVGTLIGTQILHVVVRPTAVDPGLTNTATVASTSSDADPTNNSSTATTDVRPPADVSVAMTGDVAQASVGQTIGYTVTVANAGPGPAESVAMTDELSADVDFVSAPAGCLETGVTVTCDVGALAPGATSSRRIVVRSNAPDPELLNTATVQSPTGDVNLDNNLATTLTAVRPALGLPIPAATASVPAGDTPAPQAPPSSAAPVARPATPAVGTPRIAAATRRTLMRKGLRFSQTFTTGGSARWTLALPASGSAKRVVLASAGRTLTGAGTVRVTLSLGAAGRRRLARSHATRLTLRTSFTPAGEARQTTRTVVVRLRG